MTISSFSRHFCLKAMWIWAVASCLVIYAHLLWPVFGVWLLNHAERAVAVAAAGGADWGTLRAMLVELVPALILVGLTGHASKTTANKVMAPIFDYFAYQRRRS